ncbi:MAG: ATP-binding protein [Balneola sp.]
MKSLLSICFLFIAFQNARGEIMINDNLDSLKIEHRLQKGLKLANTLIQIVEYYHNVNIDSSVYYANQLGAISDSLDFLDGKLAATTSLINADFVRGAYAQGIEKALPYSKIETNTFSYHFANLLLATGNCYGSLGLYTAGIEHYLRARKIFSELDNLEKLTTISNNLGAYYIRIGNFEDALEVFSNMKASNKDDPLNVTLKVNLGFIYLGLEDYETAENHFLSVLELDNSAIETRGKAISSYKLGNLYTEKESFEKALIYYDKSLKYYSELENEAQTMNPLNGIAKVYFLLGNNDKAKEMALKSESIGDKTHTLLELNQVVNLLSNIYEKERDYKKAYEYSQKNLSLKDSLNLSQRNQEIQVMEAEYEFERREEVLKTEQSTRLKRQRLITGGMSSFFALSLIFIFIVYKSKKDKDRANFRLEKLNQDLEETNKIKNQLFSIIAHDLRNPLTSLYGLVTLLEMKAADPKELEKLIPDLASQFKHTSTLLNNLLNWAKSQMEGYKVLPVKFDINDVFRTNIELLNKRFKEKDISISYDDNKSEMVYADKNMIDLVVLNLLSNALKYSDKEDSVTIATSATDDMLKIEVKDTGMGIPKNKIDLLFTNSFYSTSGTRNEAGTGLGLMLCKEFVERNNGKIWIESEFGKGSSFYFTLPIS